MRPGHRRGAAKLHSFFCTVQTVHGCGVFCAAADQLGFSTPLANFATGHEPGAFSVSALLRSLALASFLVSQTLLQLPRKAQIPLRPLADVEDDRHPRQDPLGGRLLCSQLGHEDEVWPLTSMAGRHGSCAAYRTPITPACRHAVGGAHVHVLVFLLLLQAGLQQTIKATSTLLLSDVQPIKQS